MLEGSLKADVAHRPTRASLDRAEVARVLVLGLDLWAVVLLVPAILAGDPVVAGASAATLTLLVVGATQLHRPRLGAALLLALYPAAILAGALWLDRRTSASPYPPVALVLGAMALLAHGAVSAQILGRPPVRADVRHRDMEAGDVDPAARGRAWRRRLALLVSALGALALALVAPFLGGDAELTTAWGSSAEAAGTLAAATGGTLGFTVLAVFVGPGLRKQRPPPASRRRWRVFLFLLVAASGVVVHTLLQRGG
tara:strand:- start:2218 stop:2982 length:765 start_codon:yes stop_codon:yes gene_type:complete